MPTPKKTTTKTDTETVVPDTSKRLRRSTSDQMIAGVAAGIAEYFEIDPTLIRLAFVIITFLGGSGVLVYLILWVVLPVADFHGPSQEKETIKKNLEEIKDRAENLAHHSRSIHSRSLWGFFLVVVGGLFLLQNFGFIVNFDLFRLWPLLLIIIGFSVLRKTNR